MSILLSYLRYDLSMLSVHSLCICCALTVHLLCYNCTMNAQIMHSESTLILTQVWTGDYKFGRSTSF